MRKSDGLQCIKKLIVSLPNILRSHTPDRLRFLTQYELIIIVIIKIIALSRLYEFFEFRIRPT